MKIRAGFMMREVAGKFVAVPVGAGVGDFKGMLQMNKTGAFLWKLLQQEQTKESLVEAMLEHYEMTEEQANKIYKSAVARRNSRSVKVGMRNGKKNGGDSR